MIKKSGLFKKILTSDSDTADAGSGETPEENPFTAIPRPTQLPPPRPPESHSKSHDPFEDDIEFGFTPEDDEPTATKPEPPEQPPEGNTPDEPEPAESEPATPTFAMPEEKQMSQLSITPSAPSAPDTESIPQLELRAIFGVDHQMDAEEILERSRKLKGVRHITRLADGDAGTIDAIKALIGRLGFGDEPVNIYAGSIPVEFIRERNVALAVQTDGGFAPGVRETLIIVARELAKM